jgi:hypothetical protein
VRTTRISRVASLREDLRRNISTGLQIKASASDEGWELSQHRCTLRLGGGRRTGIETGTVTTPVTDSVAQCIGGRGVAAVVLPRSGGGAAERWRCGGGGGAAAEWRRGGGAAAAMVTRKQH